MWIVEYTSKTTGELITIEYNRRASAYKRYRYLVKRYFKNVNYYEKVEDKDV